ncbi:MAG: hypothetical protein CMG05_03285 [Candidatus Marinimicrobia bacterium]|nr:hypothetical protein [Candidatus Neomarinimicrobiota bacterium]
MLLALWLLIHTVIYTIIFGMSGAIASLFESNKGRIFGHCARIWGKLIVFFSFIPVKIDGLSNLDQKNNYIFCVNHGSMFDIPILFHSLPFWLVPIAKIEVKKIPLLGFVMNAGGHIFVDRSNHERAINSMRLAKDELLKGEKSLMLFPEGSRSKGGNIKPFKRGGLIIAIESGIPVVPIAIINSHKLHKKGTLAVTRANIHVKIGEPIPVLKLKPTIKREFPEYIRKKVIELYDTKV